MTNFNVSVDFQSVNSNLFLSTVNGGEIVKKHSLKNMNFKDIKIKLFPIFKIISIILITSSIALELWNIQTITTNDQLPIANILNPALILAHIALSAHFIEALIAAYYAPARNQISIKYTVYTFFVGTVGLLELFDNNEEKS